MDEDDLREKIFAACLRLSMNEDGYYSATDCTDEIMKLIEAEREDDYRSWVIDSEAREH
jgi:hypothetical protein